MSYVPLAIVIGSLAWAVWRGMNTPEPPGSIGNE